jgi:putative DNA primase/helicase
MSHESVDYVQHLFLASDHVVVQCISSKPISGIERPETQQLQLKVEHFALAITRLAALNESGWNIYICQSAMTMQTGGPVRRRKQDVAAIRSVYLDIDHFGSEALANIRADVVVPQPHFILESSPGKFQCIWLVEGFDVPTQEATNKALQMRFAADPAATDCVRVLRLPGFKNHKYAEKPIVPIVERRDGPRLAPGDFKINIEIETEIPLGEPATLERLGHLQQSMELNLTNCGLTFKPLVKDNDFRSKWIIQCPKGKDHSTPDKTAAVFLYVDGHWGYKDLHTSHADNNIKWLLDWMKAKLGDKFIVIEQPRHVDIAESLAEADLLIADTGKFIPLPNVKEFIARMAWWSTIEYDKRRVAIAKRFGLRVKIMDAEVQAAMNAQAEQDTEDEFDFKPIEPWDHEVDGSVLLGDLVTFINRFVIFGKDKDDALIVALWSVGTYLIEEFNVFPRLGLTSPLENCGKSTVLEIEEHLVYRPLSSDSITASVLFRAVDEWKPTLLLDELDKFLEKNDELKGMLNSGHKKNGRAIRNVLVNDKYKPTLFRSYCALAYGMIGKPEGTLFSRSINIGMERKSAGEKTEKFRPNEYDEIKGKLVEFVRKIVRWTNDHREEVRKSRPDTSHLANRAEDNWQPLLKIAAVIGGEWPGRTLAASGFTPPRSKEKDGEILLHDIRDIIYTRNLNLDDKHRLKNIPTEVLLADLCVQKQSTWYRFHNHNANTPLDQSDLADLLRDFHISPKLLAVSETAQKTLYPKAEPKRNVKRRGYRLTDFEEAFAKYLTGEPAEETCLCAVPFF